ncbi:MAG: DMT family transporter [Gemmatimonadaceae bacterium]
MTSGLSVTPASSRPRVSPGWVLAGALLGISFAGPLVRLSGADPLAIAVWRMAFSLVVVGFALVLSREWSQWRGLSLADSAFALMSGAALALHFWAWNASVHLTTIAASVTLVSLQPAAIVAISAIFLREAPTFRQVLGIGIAIIGAMIIAAPDFDGTSGLVANRATIGNLLAVSAAVTAAIYYTVGRHLRVRYGVWAYVGLAYSACAVVLVVLAIVNGTDLYPQPSREMAIFAALAVGPMLIGHTGMNWALKYMPAYVVNLVVLGEPVGATLIGAFLPGIRQVPSIVTLAGGVVVLAGVGLAATGLRKVNK